MIAQINVISTSLSILNLQIIGTFDVTNVERKRFMYDLHLSLIGQATVNNTKVTSYVPPLRSKFALSNVSNIRNVTHETLLLKK